TVLDSGWFIYLSTNFTNLSLQNPPVLFPTHLGETYLNTHVSFIFAIFSLLYETLFFWIFPEIYFSLVLSLFYALLSLGTFMILMRLSINLYLTFLLSLLVAFNAQSLAMMGFPHFEIAIPSLMILFFVLHIKQNKKAGYAVFALLLITREDAGLHFFGLIFVFVCIEYIKSASIQASKELIKFAIIAIVYSIAVIIMQKTFFHTDDAFTRIYAGADFFSHLDAQFLIKRAEFLLAQREYLYIPIVLLSFSALFTKNYYLLIPVFSILPWTILSVCAITDMPGTLSNYYAFLFILLFAWIPVAFYFHAKSTNATTQKGVIFTVLGVVVSSMLLFPNAQGNTDTAPWKRVFVPNQKEIANTHKFKEYLKEHKNKIGNILFDEAMSLFAVDSLGYNEYLYINTFSKNETGKKQREGFTTLIFKESSSKHLMHELIKEKNLKYIYRVKHTDIVVASLQKIPMADFFVLQTAAL
ncbi:MAG: hypothetical protein QG565_959, partial [Campylobacterota bacterium]|nr:hypothetical protein [Campylobacterota bacterium]